MRSLVIMIFVALGVSAANAQGTRDLPGNPDNGRALATRACANCHVVSGDQGRSATDGVPTFASLARDPAITVQRLQGFMQSPHPPMPDLALTRREIDDIASYILSLRAP